MKLMQLSALLAGSACVLEKREGFLPTLAPLIAPRKTRPMKSFKRMTLSGASSNVFRAMATLTMGSVSARLIGVAAIPLLTRIYGPEDYGVLSVFTALVALLAPLATLRYVIALPLPRHDGSAMNLLVLSAGLMLVLTSLISGALYIWNEPLLLRFNMQVLAPWWWLIAFAVAGLAAYEMLTYWATRRRDYRTIAKTNVMQIAAGTAVKVSLGMVGIQPLGLLAGQIVAQTGGIVTILRRFSAEFMANWRYVRISRIRKLAWRYRAFPIFRIPSQLLLGLSQQAPLLFFASNFGPHATGQLSLALTTILLPGALLAQTASKAFFAEASVLGKRKPDEIREMLAAVLLRLALLSIPFVLVMFFLAEDVFTLIFGNEWQKAGTYASALSIYILFQFVQAPSAHVFFIFDGQRELLFLNIQRALIVAATFAAAARLDWNEQQTVWAYATVLSTHYTLSTIYAYRFTQRAKRTLS